MIKEDLFFIHILQKNHFIIAKMFEEEMNSPLKEEMEKWLSKRDNLFGNAIVKKIIVKVPFQKGCR